MAESRKKANINKCSDLSQDLADIVRKCIPTPFLAVVVLPVSLSIGSTKVM